MFRNSFRVGFLLGIRQLKHASKWTTGLIIFIMMLTFLNLVVVSGILVGLIEGSVKALRDQHTGDILVSTLDGEKFIERSGTVLSTLQTIPGISNYTTRYTEGATVEANYRTRRDPKELRDTLGTRIVGIDPEVENSVTNLSNFVVDGEYLEADDQGYIMLGSNMLDQYAPDFGDAFDTLEDVHPGTRIRITAAGHTKEFTVKGVIKSKVDETSFRAFMTTTDFRQFVGRTNLNINEIAVIVAPDYIPAEIKQALLDSGLGQYAKIRLSREALPKALEDIITTFDLLGNAIGSIGLVVSSITVFIVIFVNAITRRKYIGILKGIGINPLAIELSYVVQSLVYVVIGSGLAMIIIYAFLVPLFAAHPLNFPFSDGILVAPIGKTMIRLIILTIATLIAGYIPAWMIIKKNTLDSILGR